MSDSPDITATTEMNAGTPQTEPAAAPASDWRESLPETVRDWDEAKTADSPDKFWQQIGDHRSMLGRSLQVPGEDAGPETWQKFYDKLTSKVPGLMPTPNPDDADALGATFKALGTPDEASAYELPDLPGVEYDPDRVEVLRGLAHQNKLTTSQFKNMLGSVLKLEQEMADAEAQQFQQGIDGLQREWGQAFDQKKGQAEAVRKQFFPFIPEGAMNAETMKAMTAIAGALGGEASEIINQGPGKGAITPAEADTKIQEMMDNREHPFWHPENPGHAAAKQRYEELLRAAHPG